MDNYVVMVIRKQLITVEESSAKITHHETPV